jgi:Leishmanolysin
MTGDIEDTFEQAANRWMSIVKGDLKDMPSSGLDKPLPDCEIPATIDDLHICGEITEIDGVNGVLGQAGPTYWRNPGFFPYLGTMQFDSADVVQLINDNKFSTVILHEMGHVIGIGTVWKDTGVTGRSPLCPYRGSRGNREYRALSGCIGRRLPTELTGGRGTRCDHFDDKCFQGELMTGYISEVNILSRLTIATLEDIGYTVSYDEAEPYTSANMGRRCVCRRSKVRNLSIVKPIEISANNTNSNVSGMKRMLSDEGLKHAIAHGKKYLLAKRKQYSPTGTPSGLKYVGSDLISVIYKDGDNGIFSVIVTLDDN